MAFDIPKTIFSLVTVKDDGAFMNGLPGGGLGKRHRNLW
jgi:hypothetical protein